MQIRVASPQGGVYEPRHLSYSTVNGYRMCGKQFELTRVLQLEEKPGLAAIAGNAVHSATEVFDLKDWDEFDAEQEFLRAWDEQVKDRQKRSPSFKVEDYTATGRAAAAYGGKRNIAWWMDNGPGMVEKYIADREAKPEWIIPDIDGKPAVELELLFTIPGMTLPIKGFIDRVFVFPTGEFAVVDLKTGRIPETVEQLGLYRVGMGIQHGIWPNWGYWWSPEKGFVGPIDLTAWSPERFTALFSQSINGINAQVFLPKVANNCPNWCGVSRYCAAANGEKAKGVDSLAV